MDDLVGEFDYRVSQVQSLSYKEADSRLSGLWEWMNSQAELSTIINSTITSSMAEDLLIPAARIRGGKSPKPSAPVDVSGVGFLLLKEISEGTEAYRLGRKYGFTPPYSTNHLQDYYAHVFDSYIAPALEYLRRQIAIAASKNSPPHFVDIQPTSPLEITESLEHFEREHPDPSRTAFIMMQFGTTPAHSEILEVIRQSLREFGIAGLRADDKEYHEDLFPNVQTYMHGCGFGIALFERLQSDDFNPNVSLEVGYMRALRKPVCLMKDQTLRTLPTDLVGKLYRSFDPQRASLSIPTALTKWLHDKNLV